VPPGKVVRASHFVTKRWLDKQQFFQEWLRPAGNFTHGANLSLVRTNGGLTRLSYDLPEHMGEREAEAAEVLRRIGPHFRRALEIVHRLGGASAAQSAFATLLEHMEGAAFAIDRHGRISVANRRAVALLEKGDVIREVRQGLVFVSAQIQELFKQAVASCATVAERVAPMSFMSGGVHPRPVHVLPLRVTNSAAGVDSGSPLVLVLIGAEGGFVFPQKALLRKLFRLSNRQAEVVLRIANGASVRETADAFESSLPTVRNQLATAMAKLGVHRRAELVRLLAGLLPQLRLKPTDE
jgi:DNA-binding CsgD family transcriptional regulator